MENQKRQERMEDILQFCGGMLFLAAVCVMMMVLVLYEKKEWIDSNATLEYGENSEVVDSREETQSDEYFSQETQSEESESEESESEETQSEEQKNPEVTIMAVGDNLMHKSVTYSGLQEDGSWDFSSLFEYIQPDLQEADVSILCQEVVMGGIEMGIEGYPAFNTVQELGHSIVKAGFDVVAFANNHVLDQGMNGLYKTIAFWEENYPDFCYVGIHESEEAKDEIAVVEQNGIKIAILNYTYGLNGRKLPSGKEYMIDLLDDEIQMVMDIQKAKALADFIIVMPHWGTEYSFQIDEKQQRWTQMWADLGVDLVIGSHPHVVQPVQWVERKKYDTPMLVYYSLGNFVSIQDTKERMLGGMAKITIEKENGKGKAYITDHSLDFLVTHYESHVGEAYYTHITTYPLELYTPELAENHAIIGRYDSSFSYESIMKLAETLKENIE